MYKNSNNLNSQLSNAGEIGHELADHLRFDEVIETFLKKLKDVVPFDNGYVVDLRGGRIFYPLMGIESGVIKKQVNGILFRENIKAEDGPRP